MLNLEFVKGAVITKEGNYYPFGIQQSKDQKILTPINYHNTSFNKEIVPLEWFQKLNYKFTLPNMYYHLIQLSSMGFIFILHDVLPPNNSFYTIQTTINLTEKQKVFWQHNYSYFQNLFEKENTIFEAMAYNDDGTQAWPQTVKDFNEFYELLSIQKTPKKII